MGTQLSSKRAFLELLLSHLTQGTEAESNGWEQRRKIVRKPYVVNGQCRFSAPQGARAGLLLNHSSLQPCGGVSR